MLPDKEKKVTYEEFKATIIERMQRTPANCEVYDTLVDYTGLYLHRANGAPSNTVEIGAEVIQKL